MNNIRQSGLVIEQTAEVQYPDEDRYVRLDAGSTGGLLTAPYRLELEDFQQVIIKGEALKRPATYGPALAMQIWDLAYMTDTDYLRVSARGFLDFFCERLSETIHIQALGDGPVGEVRLLAANTLCRQSVADAKRVLVVTGDGELLMNMGSLATIAVLNPPNLSIVCVDNGHYGETGYQKSHTSLGVDLEKIAAGSGIKRTLTIEQEGEISAGARLIREGNASSFVLLRVKPTEPPAYKRDLDPANGRTRFRAATLGAGS